MALRKKHCKFKEEMLLWTQFYSTWETFCCPTVASGKTAHIRAVKHFILHTTATANFNNKNSGDNLLLPHISNKNLIKREGGWDLCRSFSPTPLLKQDQTQQISQNTVMLDFKYLHRWRLHHLSRKPVPVFDYPHSKKKKFFMFTWSSLSLSSCPLSLVLSSGSIEKSLTPTSLLPSIRYLYILLRSPWALSKLNRPRPFRISLYDRCSKCLIISMTLCWTRSSMSTSLLYWGAQKRDSTPDAIWPTTV